MADKLKPYAPLYRLKPLGSEIWLVDGGVIDMSYGPASLPFTTRMVVVRLPGGGLWLWSPVEPEPGLVEAVSALGTVAHIVSPNFIHYAHIPAWSALFPEARVWASPGVGERAKRQRVEVRFTDDLGNAPPEAWAEVIDQVIFRGSKVMVEVDFFHRPSGTLILADMIENVEPERVHSRWMRLLMRAGGVLAPRGSTPRDVQMTFWGRRAEARTAVQRFRDWAPERIVIAHGKCIEDNVAAEIERAFRWVG
ncbi:DUF4336 domain-containing protein [Vannielia litorea]|uniref:DUF4336 domain-containing protein n=1 Tax=Vannielia litorea TaxID=1217970 RepID=UPI001BD0F4AF|nr:DUF4336 domain-containing protein [Vannielia litorea]MBS8225795.1 DUF4336 domain-containing protein [Vannielia litorea]